MMAIASNKTSRSLGTRSLSVSVGIALVGIATSVFPSFPSEPTQLANRSGSLQNGGDRNFLGVWMENTYVLFAGVGPVEAVRLTAVDPGSPAEAAGLAAGDIVVWADGRQTRRFEDLADSVARSSGTLSLSIVQASTRRYTTLPPIRLAVIRAPKVVYVEGPRTAVKIERERREVMITYPAPQAPAKEAPRKGSDTKKDFPRSVAKDGNPASRDVSPPSPVAIRDFPWPPPKASSWTRLPPDLLRRPQARQSLLDLSRRLEAAFRKAGYVEWSYYAVPKGFAIVTQLEQYQTDGTPLKEPDRWSVTVPAPQVFSLATYLKALFSASPGHFRIVVLILTSEPVSQDDTKKVTRSEAIKWVGAGVNKLPKQYEKIPFDDDVDCTALIYEFDQATRDAQPKFEDPGLLKATIHLEKSRLLEALGP